jgi:hypothetical protein
LVFPNGRKHAVGRIIAGMPSLLSPGNIGSMGEQAKNEFIAGMPSLFSSSNSGVGSIGGVSKSATGSSREIETKAF